MLRETKRVLFVAALGFAVFALPVQAQAPAPQTPPALQHLAPQLDQIFTRFMADNHVPGLVYGIVAHGRLEYVKPFGIQDLDAKRPVTPDSLFRIASMTKAFTALTLLHLRDEGKVSLLANVEDYIPQMRGWQYPTTDSPRIKVIDILGTRRASSRTILGATARHHSRNPTSPPCCRKASPSIMRRKPHTPIPISVSRWWAVSSRMWKSVPIARWRPICCSSRWG